jgi:mycothiol synthase
MRVPGADRVDSLWRVSGAPVSGRDPQPSWPQSSSPPPPWPPLSDDEFDDVVALAARCLAADGGLPLAADPGFLRRRWTTPDTVAVRNSGGRLVAAGAVREGPTFTGLVDPAVRGTGLGARLLDWGLDRPGTVTVETEGLTAAAETLFASRGLQQVFAEDVMRIDLTSANPEATWPDGTALAVWSDATAERFAAVYDAAFRDRPGFPGISAAEWIADVTEDEEFRPDWSILATVPGVGDAGFVTAAVGWIVQVGVVPAARRCGLGAALVAESLGRRRSGGETETWLDVNVDNPGAAALYRRLGFTVAGRRARHRR